MKNEELEKAFGDFIGCHDYEDKQSFMFSIVYRSFKAGWDSAHGNKLTFKPNLKIIKKSDKAPK